MTYAVTLPYDNHTTDSASLVYKYYRYINIISPLSAMLNFYS